MKKLLLIGPLPKPFGGVSVHIARLAKLVGDTFQVSFIDESKQIKQDYFNIYNCNFFRYLKLLSKADIVHIHSGNSLIRNVHLVFSKLLFKKVVVTLHSFTRKSNLSFAVNKLFLKLANKIIVVNKEIQSIIDSNSKIVLQYAFVPPDISTEPELNNDVAGFINKQTHEGKSILIANAWRLDKYKNQDLYGLDMCIRLADKLIKEGRKVAFVFVVSSLDKHSDQFYFFQNEIKRLNLETDFLLINTELSFSKLITKADIVLRPTNTDGDALTIREALFLNKPVIASDIVIRPENTILFKNRDDEDLFMKTLDVIDNPRKYNCNLKQVDYKANYLKIYLECVA